MGCIEPNSGDGRTHELTPAAATPVPLVHVLPGPDCETTTQTITVPPRGSVFILVLRPDPFRHNTVLCGRIDSVVAVESVVSNSE